MTDSYMGVKECRAALTDLTFGDRLTLEEKRVVWAADGHLSREQFSFTITPRDKIASEMFRVFYQNSRTKTDLEGLWRMAYASADVMVKVR